MVQRRQCSSDISQVPQHVPGVLVRQLSHCGDVALQASGGAGGAMPVLLDGRQRLVHCPGVLARAERDRARQPRQRLVECLAWPLYEVLNGQLSDYRETGGVADRADQLAQLGYDGVPTRQGGMRVDQRFRSYGLGL